MTPQYLASKRKAEELSSSDGLTEPARRHSASRHLFEDGYLKQGSTGEQAVGGSRQLSLTDGGSAYATVVAGRAGLQQPSGQHKPFAKLAGNSERDASSEANIGHMYLADMSRPLCDMPDGIILNAQVAINSVALLSKRPNKTWLRALFPSSLSYQIREVDCPTDR